MAESLNILIPKELANNLDFWFQIRSSINDGYPMIPSAFYHFLSSKYDISIETLKASEKTILNLVSHLHRNPDIIGSYLMTKKDEVKSVFEQKEEEEEEIAYTWSKSYSKYGEKSRRKLCKEIPLAEFNF